MATQTFHDDSEVPAGTDFDDSSALDLGLRFSLGVDGTITHGRWRAADHLSGTPRWGLYRQSDQALLGWQDFPTYTIGAWNTIALTTPIPVLAGVPYQVVIWTPNRYVATGGYLVSSITRGDITAEAQGGRFAVQPGLDYPNNSFNNGCYFVDFVLDTGGGPSGTTPNGQAIPINVGGPVAALGLSGAPSGQAIPVALGSVAAALGRTAAPAGQAIPISLGTPTASLGRTAAPNGIAVPMAVGNPATAYGLSTAPSGLAIPISLGQPGGSGAAVTPNGLAIPISLGQPSASLARVAIPNGLAIPVAIGQPSPNAPVATESPNWPIVATTRGPLIVATSTNRVEVTR